jgi:DNA repair exonuclease SbcCD ATPase subunit
LETQVAALVQQLDSEDSRAATAAIWQSRTRTRRASYFLAQLTDGELVQLQLGRSAGGTRVVNLAGDSLALDSLWSTQRDQVYLSLCLALASALGRYGVRLPLVFDEPFARLDARASAALVAVLDDFGRRGHQVLVFTAEREAAERFAAAGARMHEMASLRERAADEAKTQADVAPRRMKRRVKSASESDAANTIRREAG